jgi:hypothetical protein
MGNFIFNLILQILLGVDAKKLEVGAKKSLFLINPYRKIEKD